MHPARLSTLFQRLLGYEYCICPPAALTFRAAISVAGSKGALTMAAALQSNATLDDGAPTTPVHGAPIDHPSAWRVADFRTPADYSIELNSTHLADISHAIHRIKDARLSLDDLGREHFDLPSMRPVIDEIRRQIEDGRGFVVLRRLPVEVDEAKLRVLDRFEEISKRPELMLEFTLQPGEMYFLNNYTTLHARTAFEDFEEEDRRRHLLRLWLDAPWMRQVHPHVHLFEGGGGIAAVTGRTPSFDWRPLTSDRIDHGVNTTVAGTTHRR
jgi:hypothetical protein